MCYWLIKDSGKVISKISVEHVTHDDSYLQDDTKTQIDQFNQRLEESLDDANFAIDGKGEFKSMYLEDVDDDDNPDIHCRDDLNTPTNNEYDDMILEARPEDDNEEAVDKYLNVELIMDVGMNDE